MKHALFFLLIVNYSLVYSQENVNSNDTLNNSILNPYSIIIDSVKLNKYRELNASNAIVFESCNVSSYNLSFFNSISSISIRNNVDAIFTLNGVPFQSLNPDISLFNIESIDISTESFNKGTNYLNGSINLNTIKPKYNHPFKVSYEGNLTSGGVSLEPIRGYYNANGSFFTNSIAIEKGKEKYATRFSYTNAINNFEDYRFLTMSNDNRYKLVYNAFGTEFTANPTSKSSINSNLYFTLKKNTFDESSDNANNISAFIFANISNKLLISNSLSINIQVAAMFSTQDNDAVDNSTPFFGTISIDKYSKFSEKSHLKSTLGFSYLVFRKSPSIYSFHSSNSKNIFGSLSYNYLKIINLGTSRYIQGANATKVKK